MAKQYEIRDELDGRVYFRSSHHPLRFVRRTAQEIADRERCDVVIVNTVSNRLLDIVCERVR